jgi:hypothetical protein
MTSSPLRRLIALWILLCWLFVSTAASFLHVCETSRSEHQDYSTEARASQPCLSCQWAAFEKSVEIAPPPVVPIPAATSQIFLESHTAPARVSLFFHASRAPPA